MAELHLAGNDTEPSVMATAFHAHHQGLNPVILEDCCASGAGPGAHEAALRMLARNIEHCVRSHPP